MTPAWFTIDRTADRVPGPGIARYRLADPWGDYCAEGEELRLTFVGAGPVEHCRAVVTGHDEDGSAIVVPLWPPLAVVGGCEIDQDNIPAPVTPLPARRNARFSTGGEAS
jgi:hypothetical protein